MLYFCNFYDKIIDNFCSYSVSNSLGSHIVVCNLLNSIRTNVFCYQSRETGVSLCFIKLKYKNNEKINNNKVNNWWSVNSFYS